MQWSLVARSSVSRSVDSLDCRGTVSWLSCHLPEKLISSGTRAPRASCLCGMTFRLIMQGTELSGGVSLCCCCRGYYCAAFCTWCLSKTQIEEGRPAVLNRIVGRGNMTDHAEAAIHLRYKYMFGVAYILADMLFTPIRGGKVEGVPHAKDRAITPKSTKNDICHHFMNYMWHVGAQMLIV